MVSHHFSIIRSDNLIYIYSEEQHDKFDIKTRWFFIFFHFALFSFYESGVATGTIYT